MIRQSPKQHEHSALLIAFINSHMPELIRVARHMKSTGLFRPIIVYATWGEYLRPEFARLCSEFDITLIDSGGRTLRPPSEHSMTMNTAAFFSWPGLRAFVIRLVEGSKIMKHVYLTVRVLLENGLYYWMLRRAMRRALRLYQMYRISLVILAEENVQYQTGVYVKTAHEIGIRSLIVPYTIADEAEAAEHILNQPALWVTTPWRTWRMRNYPQWTYTHRGKKLALMSMWKIWATERLKLAPPRPWFPNSGFADQLAVESPFMMKYYLRKGLPPAQLRLIGSVADDVLFQVLREAADRKRQVLNRYNLDPDKPVLLCAFPPPWFPRPGCDFANYRELTEFWLGALQKVRSFNVIVHLHPRLNKDDFAEYVHRGIVVAKEEVIELIPLCDLYLANISATIRWAIACGKPVLNYDVYKYRFHDYDSAGGVKTTESKAEFLSLLNRLTTDENFLRNLARVQRSIAAEWGMIDGLSGRRLTDLMIRLSGSADATLS